jgi:TetR/AcrR family transcriptional repressor of mexJK operon
MLRPQVRALHRVTTAEAIRFPELARAFYAAGPRAMHIWLTSWMADEQAHGRLRPGVLPARAAEQFTSLLRSDLFVRATPGLVEEEMASPELSAIATAVADDFLRLNGACESASKADRFA